MPTYTPVVLELQPAVVYADGQAALPQGWVTWVEIQPPPGSLPAPSVLPLPTDGRLRLKLLAGPGRYKVSYRYGSPQARPLYSEEWIVPPPRPIAQAWLVHSGDLDPLPLPPGLALYEVLEVGHNGRWQLEGDALRWLDNPPPLGERYWVRYVEAVTREQLLA